MEEALRQGGPLGIFLLVQGPRSSRGSLRALFLVKNSVEVVHGEESCLRVNRKGWEEVRKGIAVGGVERKVPKESTVS